MRSATCHVKPGEAGRAPLSRDGTGEHQRSMLVIQDAGRPRQRLDRPARRTVGRSAGIRTSVAVAATCCDRSPVRGLRRGKRRTPAHRTRGLVSIRGHAADGIQAAHRFRDAHVGKREPMRDVNEHTRVRAKGWRRSGPGGGKSGALSVPTRQANDERGCRCRPRRRQSHAPENEVQERKDYGSDAPREDASSDDGSV